MQGETIDEVIGYLDDVIAWARAHNSRMGYFACLYRRVTVEVKQRIGEGFFQDPRRMEALDVIFANRYLEAVDQHWRDETPTSAWRFSFDMARSWRPVVLQHLLLGMNAHINLDLGIAAADCVPPDRIEELHADFLRINMILSDMVEDTRTRLNRVWPAVQILSALSTRIDKPIADFALARARKRSWQVARRLARLDPTKHPPYIEKLDRWVARRGRRISRPSYTIAALLILVRLRERGDVAHHLDLLS